MKTLHRFLKMFIFVQLGALFGRALAKYLDYISHPELYAFQSAPWYTGILVSAALTAITVLLTAAAYYFVGHLLKKHQQNEGSTDTEENVQ